MGQVIPAPAVVAQFTQDGCFTAQFLSSHRLVAALATVPSGEFRPMNGLPLDGEAGDVAGGNEGVNRDGGIKNITYLI